MNAGRGAGRSGLPRTTELSNSQSRRPVTHPGRRGAPAPGEDGYRYRQMTDYRLLIRSYPSYLE